MMDRPDHGAQPFVDVNFSRALSLAVAQQVRVLARRRPMAVIA
jgi:hypothetical protein